MSEEKKDYKDIWLVIEKYVYSNSTPSHSVKKTATSVEEAIGFKLALEKLNEQRDVSYFWQVILILCYQTQSNITTNQ